MLRSTLKERETQTEQEEEKETEKRTTQMKRKNRDREGEHDMHMHILSECQICLPNYKILLSCSVKLQPVGFKFQRLAGLGGWAGWVDRAAVITGCACAIFFDVSFVFFIQASQTG